MNNQFRHVISQKIADSLVQPIPVLTRRDVWIPAVPGKAVAVIGMRRVGKTCMLWQVLAKPHTMKRLSEKIFSEACMVLNQIMQLAKSGCSVLRLLRAVMPVHPGPSSPWRPSSP